MYVVAAPIQGETLTFVSPLLKESREPQTHGIIKHLHDSPFLPFKVVLWKTNIIWSLSYYASFLWKNKTGCFLIIMAKTVLNFISMKSWWLIENQMIYLLVNSIIHSLLSIMDKTCCAKQLSVKWNWYEYFISIAWDLICCHDSYKG